MCGIIGVISQKDNVVPQLLAGLRLLEYRGYDSAGLATLDSNGSIKRLRSAGKISALAERLEAEPLSGSTGLGHTRWATHGAATEINAHPLATPTVAVIHNGIIENFQELKTELTNRGHQFESQTDTEVIVRLMSQKLSEGLEPLAATQEVLERLEGAFALVFLLAGRPDILIGARRGSPLAIGYGQGRMCLGSDALAVGPLSDRIAYLDDDDWVVLTAEGATIRDRSGQEVIRKTTALDPLVNVSLGKSGFRHFMQKEIREQPQVIGDTLGALLDPQKGRLTLDLPYPLHETPRLNLVACGTSYYAAQVGRHWLETLARIPCDLEVASEFRYRQPVLTPGGTSLFVSQSGETADTLAALRFCRAEGQKTISLVNVPGSSIEREAEIKLLTKAGPEFGVASTKTFTAQLIILAALAVILGAQKGLINAQEEIRLTRLLLEAPALMAEALSRDAEIQILAKNLIAPARDVLYLGRGTSYALALEGALKLKELSYIHAEGYAAGELKHGPIALVDENTPVIFLAPSDSYFPKTASNLEEIRARGGQVIFIGDAVGAEKIKGPLAGQLLLPPADPLINPLIYAVAAQLLAYHTAVFKGTDVDQPRNLAKSVTVE
ncbi:MAG: glutamine--fructose-6-phosphate transaminase (isomerizing) [Deltaproteobacteria bacterium]|jgi:glucosamine--fructose-6-phosphate aminotransferase (isomerizing)|nr:glutamine--fructose-6-phosphate transaminase (isomerizing) [Deltaproteobacteria bacterium]